MKKYILMVCCLTLLVACGRETVTPTKEEPKTSTSATSENLTNNSGTTMTNNGTIQAGSKVSLIYTGTYENGEVFDASSKHGNVPLEFTIGAQEVIPGLESGVEGLKAGDTKKIEIEAKDAYGEKTLTVDVPVEQITLSGSKLEVGTKLFGPNNAEFKVKKLTATTATLEGENTHPLAGKKLIFDVEIKDVK